MGLAIATRGYVGAERIAPGTFVYLYPESGFVAQNEQLLMVAIIAGLAPSDLTVTLVSDNPTIVEVPASIVISAGESIETFYATGYQIGTAQITASLGGVDLYSNIEVVGLDTKLRPKVHQIVEIKPRISNAIDLKPELYATEVPDDDIMRPMIHEITELKPRGVSARDLKPEIIDTEES